MVQWPLAATRRALPHSPPPYRARREKGTDESTILTSFRKIVLTTADGYGTAEIMRATGKAKTVIWRWQERFRDEGAAGFGATRRARRAFHR